MSPRAVGDTGAAQVAPGDTGVALAQLVLCVTSLGCALGARKLTGGPAAGFLLQALVAASSALSPLRPRVPRHDDATLDDATLDAALDVTLDVPSPPPGSWICSVLAQPLVAFGCHRLAGDTATADLLLATGAAVAAAGLAWPAAGALGHFVTAPTVGALRHFVTAPTVGALRHFVTALTAGSLLALAALSADAAGAVAAGLVALGDAAAPWAEPWVRVAASAALLGTLRGQRRRLEGR